MEKNIRNIRNEFKKNGIFYTTTELAETLKKYVDFEPQRIYDPTCGQGNLLSVFPDEAEKFGQELFADELEKAKERLKNFHGYVGDTLKDDGFIGEKFDLIVANPPFSIKWEPNQDDERFKSAPCVPTASKADYAFMLHIIHHLDDHGKAICLEFPGVLYRGNREGKIRQWMVEQNLIERVVHVPGNTFVDTAIATCVIVFNKSKHSTDIVFENLETGEEKTVSIEEIKENGYMLSISSYIYHEPEREEIDPIQIKADADNAFLQHIRATLDFEKVIAEMEGRSILPLLTSIKTVLAEYSLSPKEACVLSCSEIPNSSDSISRQAAIDALDRIFDNVPMELTTEILRLRRELRALPSADVVPVIRCRVCKFREDDDFCTGRGFPYQLVPDDGFCDKGEREE